MLTFLSIYSEMDYLEIYLEFFELEILSRDPRTGVHSLIAREHVTIFKRK
jgi:hypothetical protein